MSDHDTRPSDNEEATVGTPLQAHQLSFMPHWIKTSSKPSSSMVNNNSLLHSFNEENVDRKSFLHEDFEQIPSRIMSTEKGKISNQNTENTSYLRTETDHKKEGYMVRGFDLMSNSCEKQNRVVVPHDDSYNTTNVDGSNPIVVFRRHLSNDNLTCLGESHCCKYQKLSSTFLVHEKKDDPSMNKNLLPFFVTQQQSTEGTKDQSSTGLFPCKRNQFETMKICATVDSVENSRAHHVLFTKETCRVFKEKITDSSLRLSPDVGSSRPKGVMIRPMWTTSDSDEKGNTGMASSPLKKEDENIPPTDSGSSRKKRPITEIPDINEEVPGLQPAGSATDNAKPNTSRVHSLDAKQLFPCCAKQTSRSESNARENQPVSSETSNRWIKRLKLNSSDSIGVGTKSSEMGDASSHKKPNMFFDKTMTVLRNHGKEHIIATNGDTKPLLTNTESSTSSMDSKKRNQNILGCSWIQRWRQHPVVRDDRDPDPDLDPDPDPEPLLICEPHSLKLGGDELGKKQFPSIAAMALMGKAMNGFRPCEFRKRGSIVVWNTKEY